MTDTGASMTAARLDITAGLPKSELTMPYALQIVSKDTTSILKEVLVELTRGWCPLTTWVFITKIT
jgi:hypothetical protein